MKLRNLLALSMTGALATATAVWVAVEPAHGSTPGHTFVMPKIPEPPPPDHSHFQAGRTLMVDGRLGHSLLPANLDNQTFLYVDVSSSDALARTPAPLDLSIVIDRSGSMAGKRITNAMAAARTAIQRLRDGDTVSVLAFNTGVDTVVKPTVIDPTSRAHLLATLQTPRATGDTCISCAINTAMTLQASHVGTPAVSRILLLSDGEPTAGVRDVEGFKRLAEDCRRMGTSVTTIGVDVSFDERVMAALALSSNGHHFFVADPTGLPNIFDQEMSSLARTVANKAELTVDLAPGVFVEQVFDRAATNRGSQLVVPLGAFSAGEHKTLLARVRVPRSEAGERAIAAVRVRYDDLVDAKPGLCEGQLATRMTTDTSKLSPLDPLVSGRVSTSETNTALQQANELFREGHADAARGIISAAQTRIAAAHKAARDISAADGDEAKAAAVDKSYAKAEKSLGSASTGFQPVVAPGSSPASPPKDPTVSDRKAQEQLKHNQADSVQLAE
jgi:Ca-activated chloride channel family protein